VAIRYNGIVADLELQISGFRELMREAEKETLRTWYERGTEPSRRLHDIEEQIESVLTELAERTLVYCEHLLLPGTRARVLEWMQRWPADKRGVIKDFHTDDNDGVFSPAFDEICDSVQAIITLLRPGRGPVDTRDRNRRELLEHSLRSLAKLCFDQGVTPTKEADVKRVMHNHLAAVFSDYSQNVTIAKPVASFKPDGGILSLRAAIECKFVSSKKGAATAIRGLTEDLSGYAGTRDWRHFYSVVYLSAPFATEGQFSRALDASGNAGSWTTILVTGGSSRRQRVQQRGRGKPSQQPVPIRRLVRCPGGLPISGCARRGQPHREVGHGHICRHH
jgi:hypothetical protein